MDGIFSMMPHLDRWELGSEFNWLPFPPTNSETAPWRKERAGFTAPAGMRSELFCSGVQTVTAGVACWSL